jgi:cytochrome c biogenesis protein
MTKSQSNVDKNLVWSFFSSVKLTFVLLMILAIVSILGTLIPQMPQRESVEFARGLSPGVFRLFSLLNLFDMYHSLWFRLLIGLLVLNLIICSLDRFPTTWKRFSFRPRADRNKPFQDLSPDQTFLIPENTKDGASQVARFLTDNYKKVECVDAGDRAYFFGEKGRYAHFGVYLVHLSVLIILVGGLVGSFFGLEAFVKISEGEQVSTAFTRNNRIPLDLGFEVRCDRFLVDFYESGAPKEFRSDLTFLVNSQVVKAASVRVNHPVQFRGITFHQSTYESVPGKRLHLKISTDTTDAERIELEVEKGKPVQLPSGGGHFQVAEMRMMGPVPAALILIHPQQGEETRFWIFQDYERVKKRLPQEMLRSPKFNPAAFKPYTFYLDGVESGYATGLQVSRDPGATIVWIGCFLMVGGFFVTFFMSHRRIWVRVSSDKSGSSISVAGTASKNPVGLERELAQLTGNLKALFRETEQKV